MYTKILCVNLFLSITWQGFKLSRILLEVLEGYYKPATEEEVDVSGGGE